MKQQKENTHRTSGSKRGVYLRRNIPHITAAEEEKEEEEKKTIRTYHDVHIRTVHVRISTATEIKQEQGSPPDLGQGKHHTT